MSEFDRDEMAWVDERLEAYVDGELSPEERRRVEAFVRVDEAASRRLQLALRVRDALRGVPQRALHDAPQGASSGARHGEIRSADPPACPPEVTEAVLAQARREAREDARKAIRARARSPLEALRRLAAGFPAARLVRPSLAAAALAALVVAAALLGRSPADPAPDASAPPVVAEVRPELQGSPSDEPARPPIVTQTGPSAAAEATPSTTAEVGPSMADEAGPSIAAEAMPDEFGRSSSAVADASPPEDVEQALREIKWAFAFVSDVGLRTGRSIRREVLEERVTDPVQRLLNEALGTEPTG